MNCKLQQTNKIVVFDMDETLGYFVELGMFWDALIGYIKNKNINIKIDQSLFNKILDLYPEFLRPNIIGILNYLKKKKETNNCHKLMIYTNNQGPEEWAQYIIKYFEEKINYKLFDQIIAAFKVQGKHVELCRTTHMKTHRDLLKCTNIPDETKICFLDDVFYPGMSNENIYYINIKPYIYNLKFDEMINRLEKSGIFVGDPTSCRAYILSFLKKYTYIYVGKTSQSQNIDKILSKQILNHLHIFFNSFSKPPNKNNKTITNKNKIFNEGSKHKKTNNRTKKVKKIKNI
jgi:hypothetical protein